jgi:deoxyhypusine synthase
MTVTGDGRKYTAEDKQKFDKVMAKLKAHYDKKEDITISEFMKELGLSNEEKNQS